VVVRRVLRRIERDAAPRCLPRGGGGRTGDGLARLRQCYTERYIGTPQENPEGYADSSGLTHARKLSKPLLLIHGTADDNVYMTHSLKLAKALLDLGTPFEFVPLAGFTHMVAHPPTVVRVQERTLEFFKRHLGEPGAMRDTGL
jgi:dipeptidyl aminopeptidase/acylaminoacyl peptidase